MSDHSAGQPAAQPAEPVAPAEAAQRPPSRRRPGAAVLGWLSVFEAVLGGLLLTMIFVLVLIQAGQRFLPTGGWAWTGELARFGLVWMTFAVAGHLMANDGHVALKVVDIVATGVGRRIVVAFANLVVTVVCLRLAYEALHLVRNSGSQTSPVLEMPIGYSYVIPLIGLALTAVRSAVAIFLPVPDSAVPHSESDRAPDGGTPVGGKPSIWT